MRASMIGILILVGFSVAANQGLSTELPGRWQVRASTSAPRSEVAVAMLNGKIFLLGGYIKNSDLLEEYDPTKDHWRRRAALPKPLHHAGAAAVDGKIYLIGGYLSGGHSANTVYEYDPAVNRWSMKSPMPTARGALAVGAIDGKIYAVGGVGANGKNTSANEEYASESFHPPDRGKISSNVYKHPATSSRRVFLSEEHPGER